MAPLPLMLGAVPAAQVPHWPADAIDCVLYVPVVQMVHVPLAHFMPAGQELHDVQPVALPPEKVPAPQAVQEPWQPLFEY